MLDGSKNILKTQNKTIIILMLLFILFCLLAYPNLAESDVSAGDTILNIATINYQIDEKDQLAVNAQASFVIDRKLSVEVTSIPSQPVGVIAGTQKAVIPFLVRNQSNATIDIVLNAKTIQNAIINGNSYQDNINLNVSNLDVYVDSNANGVYDPGVDTYQYIDNIEANEDITVFVISDIPNSVSTNDFAGINLVAQIAEAGQTGSQGSIINADDSGHTSPAGQFENGSASDAGTPNTVNKQNNLLTRLDLFLDDSSPRNSAGGYDNSNNGQHSASHGFLVSDAILNLSKSAEIIDCNTQQKDDIANQRQQAYAGQCIRYSIKAKADQASTNVTIEDSVPAGTIYTNNSITLNGQALTDTSGDDSGFINNQTIYVELGNIAANTTHQVSFIVTVE